MEKFLLFSDGGASADCMNVKSDEIALYNVVDLKSIKAGGKSTLDISFRAGKGIEVVTLIVKAGSHGVVMRSITEAMNSDVNIIKVADVDTLSFVDKNIMGCSIKTSTPILYKNKIVNSTAVNVIPINTKLEKLSSMTLTNVHTSASTVQVYLQDSASEDYYIIKNIIIPIGFTLKLDSNELDYDANSYALFVKLAASTPVDIIIR